MVWINLNIYVEKHYSQTLNIYNACSGYTCIDDKGKEKLKHFCYKKHL